jgi:FtsH-binding integral membrane protein
MPYAQDDPRDFLRRVVWSLSLGLVWLVSNLGIGTYTGLMVPEKSVTIGNMLFYVWMVSSLSALIWINVRIWKKKFPHG